VLLLVHHPLQAPRLTLDATQPPQVVVLLVDVTVLVRHGLCGVFHGPSFARPALHGTPHGYVSRPSRRRSGTVRLTRQPRSVHRPRTIPHGGHHPPCPRRCWSPGSSSRCFRRSAASASTATPAVTRRSSSTRPGGVACAP